MKILVVDDETSSRIFLEEILACYGAVRSGVDGPEAVESCRLALDRGEPYHLVCMDITMPGMTGLEALKCIREEEARRGLARPRGAKIVMITARDDPETVKLAFQQLCDAYIPKPIDAAELLCVVDCLCPHASVE
jgi:two-component system, chemotaxis family, chemotaxis protein CheY